MTNTRYRHLLSASAPGFRVRIVEVLDGHAAVRLQMFGLSPGDTLQVERLTRRGDLVIRSARTNGLMPRHLAQAVWVQPPEPDPGP